MSSARERAVLVVARELEHPGVFGASPMPASMRRAELIVSALESAGLVSFETVPFPGSARTMSEDERAAALAYRAQVASEVEERTAWRGP